MREHWDLDIKIDFLNSQKEFIVAIYNWFGVWLHPVGFTVLLLSLTLENGIERFPNAHIREISKNK